MPLNKTEPRNQIALRELLSYFKTNFSEVSQTRLCFVNCWVLTICISSPFLIGFKATNCNRKFSWLNWTSTFGSHEWLIQLLIRYKALPTIPQYQKVWDLNYLWKIPLFLCFLEYSWWLESIFLILALFPFVVIFWLCSNTVETATEGLFLVRSIAEFQEFFCNYHKSKLSKKSVWIFNYEMNTKLKLDRNLQINCIVNGSSWYYWNLPLSISSEFLISFEFLNPSWIILHSIRSIFSFVFLDFSEYNDSSNLLVW